MPDKTKSLETESPKTRPARRRFYSPRGDFYFPEYEEAEGNLETQREAGRKGARKGPDTSGGLGGFARAFIQAIAAHRHWERMRKNRVSPVPGGRETRGRPLTPPESRPWRTGRRART